jgi:hypothetical protein
VKFPRPGRPSLITVGILALVVTFLAVEAVRTVPVRHALRSYTELIAAANRQDLAEARRLCSARYLRTHNLREADEGGLVGLPRNIHPNYQAWRHGSAVWICPANRFDPGMAPVYQFIPENGGLRFDGPVGVLERGRRFVPLPDAGTSADPPR